MKNFKFKGLLLCLLLSVAGISQVWASESLDNVYMDWYFNGTQFYTINNNSSYGYASSDNRGSDVLYNLGILTTDFKIKSIYWKVSTNWDPTCCNGWMKYKINDGNEQSMNYNSDCGNGNNQQIGGDFDPYHTVATSAGTPGVYYFVHWFEAYFCHDKGSNKATLSNSGSNYKFQYTIPGFTTESTSQDFGNVTVSSNSSQTISFTQHYGTALTTSNCSITGTNASEFSVTSISETEVTVQFAPSSAGSKSATLTIRDAHSKTCTISLTGNTQYTVTYNKGTYGEGSEHTDNKIYGTNLTLADAGYFTRAGYTQSAWNTDESGEGGTGYDLEDTYSIEEAVTLYPTWSLAEYTISFDPDDAERAGEATDVQDPVTVTYTRNNFSSGTVDIPVLAGYVFGGYYTDKDGTGQQIVDASGNWITTAKTGYLDASGNWIYTDDATLYAKWMGITGWTFAPDQTSFAAYTDITLTPTIANTDDVDYVRCYTLYDADENYIARQPEFEDNGDGSVTFMIDAAGSYKVKLELKPADGNCESGTLAYGFSDAFTIETNNVVTVSYQSDGVDLATPTYLHVSASGLTEEITAPSIDYYSFHHWELGSNVTCTVGNTGNEGTLGDATITISATTNGKVTAVYKTNGIFFKNTLGWENVYICLNVGWTSDALGSGATGHTFAAMTKIKEDPTGDIYYCQTPITNNQYIAFLNANQWNYNNFTDGAEVVYRPINDATPMSVPVKTHDTDYKIINGAHYIRSFWAKYNPVATGYTLKVYNQKTISGAQLLEEVAFEFVEDGMQIEAIANLESNKNLGFRFTQTRTGGADASKWQWWRDSNDGTMTYGSSTDWTFYDDNSANNCGLVTKTAGDYKFIISSKEVSGNTKESVQGAYSVSVVYPCKDGDYRLVYREGVRTCSSPNTQRSATWYHETDLIPKADGETTVQVYIDADAIPSVTLQKYKISDNTWSDVAGPITADLSGITGVSGTGSGVYNFTVTQTNSGANVTISNAGKYTGKFYIRTDCVNDDKWDYKKSPEAHEMTYSSYSAGLTNNPFSHYFVKDVASGTNVRYTVATENSSTITDTLYNNDADFNLGSETVPAMANVRFMYNQETNRIKRAFIGASTALDFLNIRGLHTDAIGDKKLFKSWASNESYTSLNHASLQEHDDDSAYDVDTLKFQDDGNWVYEATVYAKPGAKIKLTAKYNTLDLQFFKGKRGEYTTDNVETLLSGSGDNAYPMRIIYDFKINKLSTAWLPSTLGANLTINADVMLIRDHQKDAEQIRLNSYTLSGVKTVYGVMQINKWTVNNKSRETGHAVLTGNNYLSQYERDLYWISFPFDVRLKEVFGFGTYGKQWIIEYYDGKGRAEHGFWADSEPNWKFVTSDMRENGGSDGNGYVLKANEGYILALDLDEMVETKTEVWAYNEMENVYLYFPSSGDIGSITTTNKDVEIDQVGYNCTINRQKKDETYNVNKNRTIADSYWHCIGVPSYANYETNDVLTGATGTVIDWNTRSTPYLYVWDKTTNSLVATSSSRFAFKAMNSYLIQYSGEHIYWTSVANSAAPERHIAAQTTEAPDVEYFLSLTRDGVFKDRTYIRLSDDENVTDAFEFNHDLSKEYNSGENIWTITTNGVQVAGNSMPKPLQTTLVPVGVKVVTGGEYTLSMPEGTNGEDVYLIDNAYGTRTNLGLMPYTVTLTAGTYDSRFALEFRPIQETATGVENDGLSRSDELNDAIDTVRKVFVGGRLYIIRDGKVYDAAGQRIE